MYGTCGRIDNKADFDFDMSSTKENKAKDKSIEISDNNTVTIYLQNCPSNEPDIHFWTFNYQIKCNWNVKPRTYLKNVK